ncbi:DUF2777 domain-containing protein [Cytobacillus spongiae]|uniref:DUF2777 domain-containing protein n=1 Tax=Cytobacillus spongiae TaxID=2901381 RepID=UPI001F475517|nr:DUF2777 domain-containing protein [Cytobacillus spongiae]UII56958.1 DUF2777 domain-containing protein [Cytobacillus spongiae]
MNKQQRIKLMEYQTRSFTEGTVEYMNDQWVFFDSESEEASLMDDYLHQEIEILYNNRWKKGKIFEGGKIDLGKDSIFLQNHDLIRIRKHLIYSLERLLEGLSDDSFFQFVTSLNSLQFSVYDCIYCYNHLEFLGHEKRKSGVNFLIFDNQEQLCNVQHHFSYFESINDRFEFTINSGKRMIIEKVSS